jgi:hypothetical protein
LSSLERRLARRPAARSSFLAAGRPEVRLPTTMRVRLSQPTAWRATNPDVVVEPFEFNQEGDA